MPSLMHQQTLWWPDISWVSADTSKLSVSYIIVDTSKLCVVLTILDFFLLRRRKVTLHTVQAGQGEVISLPVVYID